MSEIYCTFAASNYTTTMKKLFFLSIIALAICACEFPQQPIDRTKETEDAIKNSTFYTKWEDGGFRECKCRVRGKMEFTTKQRVILSEDKEDTTCNKHAIDNTGHYHYSVKDNLILFIHIDDYYGNIDTTYVVYHNDTIYYLWHKYTR